MMMQWLRFDSNTGLYVIQGIIEDYYSVVWTERWQEYGDAQIVIPKSHDVRTEDIITIPERSMAVEVVGRTETYEHIELRCKDVMSVLDRRICYPTVKNDGLIATFITKAVSPVIGYTTRGIRPLRLGDLTALTESASLQRTYTPLGKMLTDLGATYGFNAVCRLDNGLLYVGAEKNSTVRVWGVGRFLSGYREDSDASEYATVVYVGAQEDSNGKRIVREIGPYNISNLKRREIFVDRRDVVLVGMDLGTLTDSYGNITAYRPARVTLVKEGRGSSTRIIDLKFTSIVRIDNLEASVTIESLVRSTNNSSAVSQIMSLASVSADYYDGSYSATDGGWKFDINGTYVTLPLSVLDVATFDLSDSSITTVLRDIGNEALEEHSIETIFEAVTEALTPYVDYNLGDSVTIYKEDGTSSSGIVKEIVESWDDNGYQATPSLVML